MPFFEKYQRVYGSNHIPRSSETLQNTSHTPILPTRTVSPKSIAGKKSSSAGSSKRLYLNQRQHSQEDYFGQHSRETSGSADSNINSFSTHSDFLGHLDTPETSPDFPNTPVFKLEDESDGGLECLHRRGSSLGKYDHRSDTKYNADVTEEDHQEEDDIIDSYPTPQQNFSGRFGALVIDDDITIEPGPKTAPLPSKSSLSSSPATQTRSPLLLEQMRYLNPATRSISRGLPNSQSSPEGLARLAGPSNEAVSPNGSLGLPSMSLNGRRRSKTGNSPFSPAFHGPKTGGSSPGSPYLNAANNLPPLQASEAGSIGGSRLPALDDLLKEMNRESLVGTAADQESKFSSKSVSSSSSGYDLPAFASEQHYVRSPALLPSGVAVAMHCESCKKQIQAKAIKRDGRSFCSACYAMLYLPKCRKCKLPIEGKATGSGDGKVKGKVRDDIYRWISYGKLLM